MEEYLVQEIARRFKRTPRAKRIAEVKEFMNKSAANRQLIKKSFPDLYAEAQGPNRSSSGGVSQLIQHFGLYAKPE
jgi:hypothetical protein